MSEGLLNTINKGGVTKCRSAFCFRLSHFSGEREADNVFSRHLRHRCSNVRVVFLYMMNNKFDTIYATPPNLATEKHLYILYCYFGQSLFDVFIRRGIGNKKVNGFCVVNIFEIAELRTEKFF